MGRFTRERGGGESKRMDRDNGSCDLGSCPFGELGVELSQSELRETAYEVFIAACRPSGGKPLTYISQADSYKGEDRSPLTPSPSSLSNSSSSTTLSSSSTSLQRSLTSTAASTVKKALGLRASKNSRTPSSKDGMSAKSSKKPMTISELMRIQMKISEQKDGRIRRALLRIAAGQLGKRVECIVLPLEFLQQFKSSDFQNHDEYEAWRSRNLKLLEAGLLLHPLEPLDKGDVAGVRLRQVLNGAVDRPLETGKNSESMQVLRSAVMPLASRAINGFPSETCHWADGLPFNLILYQMLLEACFDGNEDAILIDEVDDLIELIKKTWTILGMNQMLHNLCFSWVLFNRFIETGQTENGLLFAAENQLVEVAKDSRATTDPAYANVLNSTLTSMLGWAEKRLLAYHDTFQPETTELMQSIVSLGVSAAKILVEDISNEYRRKRRDEANVACQRVETYIRSSLKTAFAQKMEQADSNRRSSRNLQNTLPVLAILANDIGELATYEKGVFSPILKSWNPLAAGVAVATLHSCYGRELKQFMSGVSELTPDVVQILKAADKLEKELVHIAVEDSVDSEDGGKAIIREMPPYEAEAAMANLAKTWIKVRVERMREWIDRNLQQEVWDPKANKEKLAPSIVEVLRTTDETIEAFFQLPIPMHQDLLPDLVSGLDKGIQHYISKAKTGCGSKSSFIPTLPALTRCTTGSKFFKKKEKLPVPQKKKAPTGGPNDAFGLLQLCVRMNTLHQIRTELEVLEKRIISHLRNTASATSATLNGTTVKFELSYGGCHEGIQQLCEATAYKVVFHDLSYVLWDGLYVGEPATSNISSFLKALEPSLEMVASTVHNKVRTRVLTALMKASFDGFLLVLLAGGPYRAYGRRDVQIMEEDFISLKKLFLADGDGLPQELVQKAGTPVTSVLPLFGTDSEELIRRFHQALLQAYGDAVRSRPPIPPTPDSWSPSDPNTILRVLCYRNDEAATKFLKKTYGLPKKL